MKRKPFSLCHADPSSQLSLVTRLNVSSSVCKNLVKKRFRWRIRRCCSDLRATLISSSYVMNPKSAAKRATTCFAVCNNFMQWLAILHLQILLPIWRKRWSGSSEASSERGIQAGKCPLILWKDASCYECSVPEDPLSLE